MKASSAQTHVLEAHAKVNLCLSVQYPPADGYHQLDSVFHELSLCDTLVCKHEPLWTQKNVAFTQLGSAIALACDVEGLAVQDNLIFRALDAVERECGFLVAAPGSVFSIEVEKHIPAGGGLGGGSSDAACALKEYARIAQIDALDERIVGVARSLGADVAFFLYGGTALMDERGDHLVRRLPVFKLPIVLMGDAHGMSTARIYADFDEHPPAAPDAHELAHAIETRADAQRIATLCANNLEPAACAQSEKLAERLRFAREHPCVLNALVTGSGSTSFAICPDETSARAFAHDIAPLCAWVELCLPEK